MTQRDPAAASKGKAITLARAVLNTLLGGSASTGGWVSDTTSGTWVANTTYSVMSRIVGDTLESRISIQLAGAPTSAALSVNIPGSRSIDGTKLIRSVAGDGAAQIGYGTILDSGTATLADVVCLSTSSNGNTFSVHTVSAGALSTVTQAAPITFANGDRVNLYIQVPIA